MFSEVMISACANSTCSVSLSVGDGQYYRFHCDASGTTPKNSHSVRHFWLCQQCSLAYTLEGRTGVGIFLRQRLNPFARNPLAASNSLEDCSDD